MIDAWNGGSRLIRAVDTCCLWNWSAVIAGGSRNPGIDDPVRKRGGATRARTGTDRRAYPGAVVVNDLGEVVALIHGQVSGNMLIGQAAEIGAVVDRWSGMAILGPGVHDAT
jgi:hypothetical protein